MTSLRSTHHIFSLVLCASLACSATSASAIVEPSQPAVVADNKAVVAAAFDRWAAGGSDFFNEVVAPDVVWTIEGSGPYAGTYHGRDDLMKRAVRPITVRLKTPIRPVSRQVWADGGYVIVQWTGEAVAGDGKPYINRYAWILRMENARAIEVTAFLDLRAYEDVLQRVPQPEKT
ncbi:nuclear transport factor 2 family protein [Pseudomonas sp. REB1044]|uniref:nuclear transport factor 2 family protein n=1 Tax=Pseudomonas sp. REB1044 TaxID=2675224 RepID=UPI00315DBAF0